MSEGVWMEVVLQTNSNASTMEPKPWKDPLYLVRLQELTWCSLNYVPQQQEHIILRYHDMSSKGDKTIFKNINYWKVFASNYVDGGCAKGKKQFVKRICVWIMSSKTKNLLRSGCKGNISKLNNEWTQDVGRTNKHQRNTP